MTRMNDCYQWEAFSQTFQPDEHVSSARMLSQEINFESRDAFNGTV